jgi:hypothetical protein
VFSTHIFVAHSNNAIASRRQESSPGAVIVSLSVSIVYISLELDDDPFAGAKQIHDEPVQDVLSPKLQAEDAAVAEERPRMTFSGSRMSSKLTRTRESLGCSQSSKWIHPRTLSHH